MTVCLRCEATEPVPPHRICRTCKSELIEAGDAMRAIKDKEDRDEYAKQCIEMGRQVPPARPRGKHVVKGPKHAGGRGTGKAGPHRRQHRV